MKALLVLAATAALAGCTINVTYPEAPVAEQPIIVNVPDTTPQVIEKEVYKTCDNRALDKLVSMQRPDVRPFMAANDAVGYTNALDKFADEVTELALEAKFEQLSCGK
ncbi:hypothetical protein SM033_00150 [Vibrio phage vB_VpaM_sm033]|nr:hypothetical protein SM033_00150 [Vibrio phage vB_VpaM_sm033]